MNPKEVLLSFCVLCLSAYREDQFINHTWKHALRQAPLGCVNPDYLPQAVFQVQGQRATQTPTAEAPPRAELRPGVTTLQIGTHTLWHTLLLIQIKISQHLQWSEELSRTKFCDTWLKKKKKLINVSLCSSGLPWIHKSPVFASQVQGKPPCYENDYKPRLLLQKKT